MKIVELANSVDPDQATHHKPPVSIYNVRRFGVS